MGSQQPTGVAEVVVTAEKRSERINDVPLAITALSGAQLAAHAITDTSQLEKVIPGFTVQKSFLGQPVFFIRGVGFSDKVISISPAVSVYTDEAPLPFSAMARGATIDLERVEVLKGPQGTLFGQNSTGGAINFIAAKPTKTFDAGVDVSAGSFNLVDAAGFVSGPLSENVSARLAVQDERQGDWQYSISRPNDTRGQRDFFNSRAIVDYTPTDKVKFELSGQVWRDQSDIQAAQFVLAAPTIPFSPPANPATLAALESLVPAPAKARAADWDAGSPTRRNDTFYQLALRSDVALSGTMKLTSITDYTYLNTYTPVDADGSAFLNSFFNIYAKLQSISQELRLAGDYGSNVEWLVGGNYVHQNTDELQKQHFNTTSNSTTPFPYTFANLIDDQIVDSYAAFANIDYHITDTLTARGAVRYTQENRSFSGCGLQDAGDGNLADAFAFTSTFISGSPTTISPGSCVTLSDTTGKPLPVVDKTLNQDNVSWRTGLDWKAAHNTLFYVTIAKGYKSGSFTEIPAVFASQLAPVTQESVLDYEAGAKLSLFDRRVQLNGSAFYYDYTDKQIGGFVDIVPFGNLPKLVNIPKSSITGAEFDFTWQVTQGLRLQTSGTYIDSKIENNPDNPVCPITAPGTPCSFVGESFPYTPKFQATADVEQRIPLGDEREAYFGGGLVFHSSTSGGLTGSESAIANSAFRIPQYTLLDLRAGVSFRDGKCLVELWGHNVTNKFYLTGAGQAFEEVTRFTGMPATYGVRFKWRM